MQSSVEERNNLCWSISVNLMEDIASSIYLSDIPEGRQDFIRARLQTEFNALIATLVQMFQQSSWLEEPFKVNAINKIESITVSLEKGMFLARYPDQLEGRWKGFKLGDNFVQSSLALVRQFRRNLYQLMDHEPDHPDASWSFHLPPTFTESYNIYGLSKVVIPYGTVANGYTYNPKLPAYWNLGRIGFLMARQVMHNFDETGISYSSSILRDYHNETAFGKDLNLQLLRQRIENYNSELSWVDPRVIIPPIRSRSIVNQAYAETTGLELSWLTYQEKKRQNRNPEEFWPLPLLNMTDAQLFFLATAQMYCTDRALSTEAYAFGVGERLPDRLRVYSLTANSAQFEEAFNCPAKSSQLRDQSLTEKKVNIKG